MLRDFLNQPLFRFITLIVLLFCTVSHLEFILNTHSQLIEYVNDLLQHSKLESRGVYIISLLQSIVLGWVGLK